METKYSVQQHVASSGTLLAYSSGGLPHFVLSTLHFFPLALQENVNLTVRNMPLGYKCRATQNSAQLP